MKGINGDDKNVGKGFRTRIEQKIEETLIGTKITESVYNVRKNGKREYLTEQRILFDYKRDGVVDELVINKFDRSGNLVEESVYKMNDGKDDEVIKRKYDENGNRVEVSIDKDGDGEVDEADYYKYDENDKIIRHEYKDSRSMADRLKDMWRK